MKKIYMLLWIGIAILSGSGSVWADVTAQKTIDWIRVNSDIGFYYFVNDSGWGVPACPNAKHAYIDSNSNRKRPANRTLTGFA